MKSYNIICAMLKIAAAIWRIIKMTNTAMNCIKGIGIGVAIGAAAGIACKCASNSRKHTLKYRARHAADAVENMLGSLAYMFK